MESEVAPTKHDVGEPMMPVPPVAPTKHDAGKPRVDLFPPQAILAISKVLGYGAEKYSDHNWQNNGGMKYSRLYAAAQRHMLAFWDGEQADGETGMSHLAHAACCIVFLLSYEIDGNGIDDRRD